jgi:acyl dehydratase
MLRTQLDCLMEVRPHQRFSSEITLTPELVGAYARAAGDDNPVHHDAEFAATTRYGRLIASGTHTTALLLGLTASHFSKQGAMVGLEFWVRFRRPVYADEPIRLEWLVIKVTRNEKLGGRGRRAARARPGQRWQDSSGRQGARAGHRSLVATRMRREPRG